MRFFGLKTCDTCRKALKSLAEAGMSPEVIDVRKDGISAIDLAEIVSQFGEAAINKASTTWRGLDNAEKARAPLELLQAYPALMKRPLIEDAAGTLFLGWTKDTQAALM